MIGIAALLGIAAVAAWGALTYSRRPTMRTPVARLLDPAPGVAPERRGVIDDHTRYVVPFRQGGFEGKYESAPVDIPAGAALDFALGAAVAPHGDRVVTFEIRECETDVCNLLFSERVDFATGVREWRDRQLSLAPLAGKTRRFAFRVVTTSPATRAFVANPTIFAPTARPHTAYNVILLSLDTLRASRLGSYGYHHETSPFIDAIFARGGTRFEHCVAPATNTTPSHMTMFTSLPPSVHRVGLANVQPLPTWMTTVPELFRKAGFTTAAITENGWVTLPQGFGRGFDTYRENKGHNMMEPRGQADLTFAEAEQWLRAHRDERFFLFLHTYQVHAPYVPPVEYAALFAEQPGIGATIAGESANYDREIRFTDDMLRKLYAVMHELDLAARTIVVLTSDHGEEFAEHGCEQHAEQLYDEVTRVPLMIAGPGVPRGVVVPEPVGSIDVMPTLLELGGVPPSQQAMGVSLVAAMRSGAAPSGRRLVTESWAENICPGKTFGRPGFVVRQGPWKLARYQRDSAHTYELYDVATDPQERDNRADTEPERRAELQAHLDGYESECRTHLEALRARMGAPAGSVEAVPLDARQREKLRALGYME